MAKVTNKLLINAKGIFIIVTSSENAWNFPLNLAIPDSMDYKMNSLATVIRVSGAG